MAKSKAKKKQTDDVGQKEGVTTHALDERSQYVADILESLTEEGYLDAWDHTQASNGENIFSVTYTQGKRTVQRSLFLASAEAFVLGADVVRNGGDS